MADSGSYFKCPYCSCIFVTKSDLDSHLKAFGDFSHKREFECKHILLEADGYDAGVDNHSDWHWSYKKNSVHANRVRACRKLLSELS